MKRNAFTLVEILISIALFGLIVILLFGTIDNLRYQLAFYKSKEENIDQTNQILSLMRSDFDRPKGFTQLNNGIKDYAIVSIQASNRSLHGLQMPYVIWVVLKRDNTLIRLESSEPINLPLTSEAIYRTHSDTIGSKCKFFRVFESNETRLGYLQFEDQPPIIVETVK